jgi:ABC-2 type transport system ATP-binding protein
MPSEDRSLLMRATSWENLQLHGRLQGMPRKDLKERIGHVLDIVNLTPQTHAVVAGLSAGMRARLRLARALLPGPRALILDEPTGPVDPIAAYGLLTLIMELAKQERLAVMISSHRLEEIEALRSHALLLDGGKVRYSGDLDSLRKEWERPEVEFVAVNHQAALSLAEGLLTQGIEASVDETSVRCRPTGPAQIGTIVTRLGPAAASIAHIREIPMPLRDLIAQVYSQGGQA